MQKYKYAKNILSSFHFYLKQGVHCHIFIVNKDFAMNNVTWGECIKTCVGIWKLFVLKGHQGHRSSLYALLIRMRSQQDQAMYVLSNVVFIPYN